MNLVVEEPEEMLRISDLASYWAFLLAPCTRILHECLALLTWVCPDPPRHSSNRPIMPIVILSLLLKKAVLN